MGLRRFVFAIVIIGTLCGVARAQSGSLPDAPSPKVQPGDSAPPSPAVAAPALSAQTPAAAREGNPFPDEQEKSAPVVSPNAAPEPVKNNDAAQQNPFPEEREKSAPLSQDNPGFGATPPRTETPPEPEKKPGWSSSDDKPALTDAGSAGADPKAVAERGAHDKAVAKIYYGLGNWEGAYLRYRDALAADPKDADAAFGLAECERRMGRYVTARTHYALYLQLQPAGKSARQAQKALADLPQKDAPQPAPPFAPKAQMP